MSIPPDLEPEIQQKEPTDGWHALTRWDLSRGRAWSSLEQFDKAIRDLDTAIKLDPGLAVAWAYRSSAKSQNEADLDDALSDINEAIRLDPNSAYAYTVRGTVWEEDRSYQ